MAALFCFEVYTPYRMFFSDSVEAVILTLADGEAGIYAGHTPFTAPVSPGLLKIKDKHGEWKIAFTSEGILEVKGAKNILVSDTAEWPEEIDCERAQRAKKKAEEILAQRPLKFQAETATASLNRAQFRIKIWELAHPKAR